MSSNTILIYINYDFNIYDTMLIIINIISCCFSIRYYFIIRNTILI